MPTFGSLFSGVGGIDLGLERAGWECRWQVEIDEFRRGVLARHWPSIPRFDDVRGVLAPGGGQANKPGIGQASLSAEEADRWRVDLICGGFPCQDISVAGRRAGLAGSRSGLFFEFVRVAGALRPELLLIENVPGLFSSPGVDRKTGVDYSGADFAVVLGTLADLGYGVAWRTFDSRFFGVPQRRRRVFIVGALPGGRAGAERAGAILAVGQGCDRHPAKGRQARTSVAGTLEGGAADRGWRIGADEAGGGISLSGLGSGGADDNDGQAGRLIAGTVRSHMRPGSNTSDLAGTVDMESARRLNFDGTYVKAQKAHDPADIERWEESSVAPALDEGGQTPRTATAVVSHALTAEGHDASEDGTGRGTPIVAEPAVRRFTPVECCRLQGFPDDWLGEPNEPPDSPRYAAMGDAVTVGVAQFIGEQLLQHLNRVSA